MSSFLPAQDDEIAVASEHPSDAAAQIILISGLTAYNEARVGPDPVRDPANQVCIVARDRDGRVRGGAQGVAVGAWLALDTVWVEDDFRGRGLGARVLEAAEAEGRRRGCKWAILATFEYQAPDFYSRRGYVEYARMEDFPWGHTRFQLRKAL
ncbi:Acetyltransferase (GNAT) family protein [Rhodoblastus acidophilus]|uniref:Acetyltransferase (GNAT) family protein n=1 Tax=Rhodoblastus acidophilus TaxID=1074 RepID=A0A212QPX1_RHOAC|nr:GNAT family N-acetyltransferase [Rhodoblastus acidophilus]MCW2317946.1 GNAT superfamily N-acetyltransferase [Rhodoblastus acidophilus]PPQ36144.1 N-acetyltransferase [Rhodoblastus acidophilus]RAI16521.1 N-acetyltransferase [Rhodoblastus acidophilus]SNB61321.1 Acetyltransferase (GNAT) family protein [Rhodoblastus acidophilus]